MCDVMNKRFGIKGKVCYLKNERLKDARQFHAFVSKTRSGLRKHYKVVVEENDEDVEE